MEKKLYTVENFDIYNFSLIKSIVEFFVKKYPNLKIKIDDEMTGWIEEVSKKELYKLVSARIKKYTGLDKINLEVNNEMPVQIIFHENSAFLEVDNVTKDEIEKKFNIKLKIFKQNA